MQGSCIITRIMSLRRLKTGLFHLKMNFKKELDMSAKALPEWMKVTKKDLIGKKGQNAKNNTPFGKVINFSD